MEIIDGWEVDREYRRAERSGMVLLGADEESANQRISVHATTVANTSQSLEIPASVARVLLGDSDSKDARSASDQLAHDIAEFVRALPCRCSLRRPDRDRGFHYGECPRSIAGRIEFRFGRREVAT